MTRERRLGYLPTCIGFRFELAFSLRSVFIIQQSGISFVFCYRIFRRTGYRLLLFGRILGAAVNGALHRTRYVLP